MTTFNYRVTIDAETQDHADLVITERIEHDEQLCDENNLPVEYAISYGTLDDDRPVMALPDAGVCTIAFSGEAHESAETMYTKLLGWSVEVIPYEGEPFSAEVGPISYDEDGFQVCTFYVWDDEAGRGDRNDTRELLIYEGIDRIEVN